MYDRRLRTAGAPALVALVALVGMGAIAQAAPSQLLAAYRANDEAALERLSTSAADAQERAVAAGAALSLRRQDAAAIRVLTAVTRSGADSRLRATAFLALSDVYIRDGQYGASYSSLSAALRLSPQDVRQADRQAMAFAHVLSAVQPMRLVHAAYGSLEAARDKGGLIRLPLQINGHTQYAVMDTGAAFSTLSASAAKHAGIHLLDCAASVGSSTEKAVASRLGIARRLRIGNALLGNVVFIVLPDSALTFANGAYKIDAILGIPPLIALGRIEVTTAAKEPEVTYGRPPGVPSGWASVAGTQMLISGLQPLIFAQVSGSSDRLRMLLDTGANVTIFNHHVLADVPELRGRIERHAYRVGGAGGASTDQRALRLPAVALTIAAQRFSLKDVSIASSAESGYDGIIGQDLIRQGGQMVIDFNSMRFGIEK